jgi:hypothetical protein
MGSCPLCAQVPSMELCLDGHVLVGMLTGCLVPLQHTASYDAQVSEWLWGKVGSGPAPEISVPMKLAEGLR